MKTFFITRKNKKESEDKKLKKCFQLLTLIFTISLLTLAVFFTKLDEAIENKTEEKENYASVFKESKLHQIIFCESTEL